MSEKHAVTENPEPGSENHKAITPYGAFAIILLAFTFSMVLILIYHALIGAGWAVVINDLKNAGLAALTVWLLYYRGIAARLTKALNMETVNLEKTLKASEHLLKVGNILREENELLKRHNKETKNEQN